jgi:hypothetical protein
MLAMESIGNRLQTIPQVYDLSVAMGYNEQTL